LLATVVIGLAVGGPGRAAARRADHAQPPVDPDADDDGIEPEGGVGGYAVERLESELSIHVPESDVETVWHHLASIYGGVDAWPSGVDPKTLHTRLSDETFVDRYYDTPDLEVLARQNGVRWRSREVPNMPSDPKDDRQLVQVKVTSGGDTVTRGEYKFPLKRSVLEQGGGQGLAAVDLVREKYHKDFQRLARGIGVDPTRLREVLRLDQHRRRVYFSDAKGPMMTITLDQATARKWWAQAPWTEIEVEIGEVRYTNASPEERAYMTKVRTAMRADLFAHFSGLYEDDMPKYTEAFARLEHRLPLMRRMIAVRENVLPISVAGLGAAALVGVGLSLGRRGRGGRSGGGRRLAAPRAAA
jgi:hypothetical protein